MKLPKIDVPVYTIVLPSTEEKIKYRPFLVKEEKILMIALQSDEEETMVDSIKQIISNCILDEEFDVDSLTSFDIEYFFLQLRSKSIGETVTLKYKNNNCNMGENGSPCGVEIPVIVKLDDIKPIANKDHNKKIELTDDMGIIMKYPTLIDVQIDDVDIVETFNLIANCIDVIYDKNGTYESDNFSNDELVEFIESMTQENFNKIQKFFDSMPSIEYETSVVCERCGLNEKIVLRTLSDFFA